MKYILFIGDGMADLPVKELQNKTVLEYTICPSMNALASAGTIGTVQTVPVTIAPGTDTAFYGIMGYDVEKCFTGRAPLEAAGVGIAIKDDEIAFRCNLVNISDDPFDLAVMGSHSAFNIDHEVGKVIMQWLIKEPEFKNELEQFGMRIEPGYGFRHIALLKNKSNFDIKNDFEVIPPHDIVGKSIRDYIKPQTNTNRLIWRLMRKSNEILKRCPYNEELIKRGLKPGNCIWLWGAGTKPTFMDMHDRYDIHGAVISAVPIVNGIGNLCGLTPIKVEGITGDKNTNYQGKAKAAVDALLNKGYDFVLVHVEAPDECSHDGDIDGKIYSVKNIDEMIRTIGLGLVGHDFRIMVMADHITSLESRTHDWGSVPYLLYDSRTHRERGISFDESSAKKFGEEEEHVYNMLNKLFEKPY